MFHISLKFELNTGRVGYLVIFRSIYHFSDRRFQSDGTSFPCCSSLYEMSHQLKLLTSVMTVSVREWNVLDYANQYISNSPPTRCSNPNGRNTQKIGEDRPGLKSIPFPPLRLLGGIDDLLTRLTAGEGEEKPTSSTCTMQGSNAQKVRNMREFQIHVPTLDSLNMLRSLTQLGLEWDSIDKQYRRYDRFLVVAVLFTQNAVLCTHWMPIYGTVKITVFHLS